MRAVAWMRASDPEALITPGKVYRALGRRADCGGCLPLFIDTMRASGQLEIGAPLICAKPLSSARGIKA